MNGITETRLQWTGLPQIFLRKNYEQGLVAPETQEALFQEKLKEEEKRIQPIYNSKGKLVDCSSSGTKINILLGNYYQGEKRNKKFS